MASPFRIADDNAAEIYFIAKTFGKLPAEVIDEPMLLSFVERFEVNRYINYIGKLIEKKAHDKAQFEMEQLLKNKGKGGKRGRK